jgi:hypothetical protein
MGVIAKRLGYSPRTLTPFAPLEPEDLATLSRLLDKILRAQAPEFLMAAIT